MSGALFSRDESARCASILDGLRAEWRRRYGAPPALRSVELLRLMLAWRIQADSARRSRPRDPPALRACAPSPAEGLSLGVGARFRREWQGSVVEVEVTEKGFRYDGQLYPSLSQRAPDRRVKWNGPRFFGLRGPASEAGASESGRAGIRTPTLRCAIYTRKSSEEGLDQAFNSLHAQREACEAYVKSQAGEGWKALADALRRWRLLGRHDGAAGPQAPARRHRRRAASMWWSSTRSIA